MRAAPGVPSQPAPRWPLLAAGAGVLALAAVRALTQSITIDEGDTYVYWLSGKIHEPWYPHSNNHLLNTYLIGVFVRLFGLSNVSMRLPAFLGACLYVSAAYRFCMAFAERLSLRLPLYLCLIVNPLVLDFFVAARGYGLAVGLFAWALVVLCGLVTAPPAPGRLLGRVALASGLLGLSFAANFSFALADAASLGIFLVVCLVRVLRGALPGEGGRVGFAVRLLAAATIPAAAAAGIVAGWTLAHWPRGQLVYGAISWGETWESIAAYAFSSPNPRLLPVFLARALSAWGWTLAAALGGVWLLQWAGALAGLRTGAPDGSARRAFAAGGYLAAVLAATMAAHAAAFRLFGLLLPKDRTAIFLVPLALMAAGAAAGLGAGGWGRGLRRASAIILAAAALGFLGSLRLHYFLLWRFDADIRDCYERLVRIVGRGQGADVPCSFDATSALNYYREYFHDDSFQPFYLGDNPRLAAATHYTPYPLGAPAYVLYLSRDADFIAENGLRVAYRGRWSDLVIAVPPRP